jgi:hypothetical protein
VTHIAFEGAGAALADMGKRFTAAWKPGRSPAHVFTLESARSRWIFNGTDHSFQEQHWTLGALRFI